MNTTRSPKSLLANFLQNRFGALELIVTMQGALIEHRGNPWFAPDSELIAGQNIEQLLQIFCGMDYSAPLHLPFVEIDPLQGVAVEIIIEPQDQWSSVIIIDASYQLNQVRTQRQAAIEQHLQNEEQEKQIWMCEFRFHDAIEALPDGFVIYDNKDRLQRCNHRVKDLYAESAASIQEGRTFEDILRFGLVQQQFVIAQDQSNDDEQFIQTKLQQHRTLEGYSEQQLSSGKWVRIVERPMRGGGIVGFHMDITELKQKETELVQQKRRAEDANRAKSTFLATVSHEIRTPMNSVLGLLDILKQSDNLDNTERHYVQTAVQSAAYLQHMLDEILDISNLEAGKLELEQHEFSVKQAITKAMSFIELESYAKGLTLVSDLQPELEVKVFGDQGRLQQVLTKILANAVKFTHQGEIKVTADIKPLSGKNVGLSIRISDTGIGFDQSKIAQLFEAFAQQDSTSSRQHEGAGLGLAVSKKLLDLMGGTIAATSKPGAGATFEIFIPFTLSSQNTVPANRQYSDTSSTKKTQKILLADDSISNQIVIEAMLSDDSYIIEFANDGKEAVEAVKEGQYDVILMDICMPNMDGVEASKLIRALLGKARTPIIAVTANALKGDLQKMLAAGMNDYLPKPVVKQHLVEKLNDWLNRKHFS